MEQEYLIPERNLGWVQGKLEKLNKRAEKLGVPGIQIRIVAEEMRTVRGNSEEVPMFGGRAEKFYKVLVSGEAPVLNGWTFVATLQHVAENGNSATIVLAVPGETVPAQYRETDGRWCDHCRTHRDRNDTFIVKKISQSLDGSSVPVKSEVLVNPSGDTYQQVGRQCLKDFLGHVSPHKLADWATELGLLDSLFEGAETEDYQGGGRGWLYVRLDPFMAFVSESVARHGWVSRRQAREQGGVATADDATNMMEEWREEKTIVPTKANIELSQRAIEWAREELPEMVRRQPDNDFLYNLATVTRLDFLGQKMLGIAAALMFVYMREMQKRAPSPESGSEHFGTVGARGEFTLRVVELRGITYQSGGEGVLVRFEDGSGNVATWFTSSGRDFVPGKTYRVKASVRRHDVFKGAKQTVLNRVQMVEEVS